MDYYFSYYRVYDIMDETRRDMIMIGKCGLREDTGASILKGFSQVLEGILQKDEWKLGRL